MDDGGLRIPCHLSRVTPRRTLAKSFLANIFANAVNIRKPANIISYFTPISEGCFLSLDPIRGQNGSAYVIAKRLANKPPP